MTPDEVVRQFQSDPDHADLVRNCYWDLDRMEACERFLASGEFEETLQLLGEKSRGVILDLGAGGGIASYAFARSGAERVIALEPDDSALVGRGALGAVAGDLPIEAIAGFGEDMPLEDGSVDVVYARAVLHHARDLPQVLRECHRVLRSKGVFMAAREHVVDNAAQLEEFLASHPTHRFTLGENAFSLDVYKEAILAANFDLRLVLGPWDSVVNAFPTVGTAEQLLALPGRLLTAKLGAAGSLLGRFDPVRRLVVRYLDRPIPGRPFTFIALKP